MSLITCPACNYTRQPTDNVPEWECPKCQKAYNKTDRLEHPQVSAVMTKASAEHIQVSISGKNDLESDDQIHFEGAHDVDPVAMKTNWTSVVDRTITGKPEMVEVSSNRIEFSRNQTTRKFAMMFIIAGIIAAVCNLHSRNRVAVMTLSFLFVMVGCFIPYIFNNRIVFDKIRGYFWKGRKDSDDAPDMNSVQELNSLDHIHAVQLIYWHAHIASNYLTRVIELNLILNNGRRVNVATYQPPSGSFSKFVNIEKKPREHAIILGKFLGKPVWDAIDSTKSYWTSKRFV